MPESAAPKEEEEIKGVRLIMLLKHGRNGLCDNPAFYGFNFQLNTISYISCFYVNILSFQLIFFYFVYKRLLLKIIHSFICLI